MRLVFLLMATSLAGCASFDLAPESRRLSTQSSENLQRTISGPSDEVVLFDTTMIRKMRELKRVEQRNLSGGARIGLWVGLGVGAVWLYNEAKDATEEVVDNALTCVFSLGTSDTCADE